VYNLAKYEKSAIGARDRKAGNVPRTAILRSSHRSSGRLTPNNAEAPPQLQAIGD
jgi:hypothetical protein